MQFLQTDLEENAEATAKERIITLKVDLHCHTKATKQGDGVGRNVSAELFKEKIANADVKIVAITNHNAFDFEQYNELKVSVSDYCQVWPGVEIDIAGEDNKYHLIVVANPDNVKLFSDKTEQLFKGKNVDDCKFGIGEVYNKLNECDVIYIPHIHKKPGISEKDYKALQDLVSDNARVFCETQDHRSLGVFANHNYNVIIGSDVKNWEEYEKSTFAELKLPVENFTQFYLLSKKDDTIVNTLLNKKDSYKLKGKPHKSVSIDLKIFQDVNIVFGQKGTGKSEIINSLYEDLTSKGIKCTKYIGAEKEESFKNILNTADMKASIEIIGVSDCISEFDYVKGWTDKAPTLFSDYIKWFNTKDNNANKSRMKLTNASSITEREPEYFAKHKNDFSSINEATKHLDNINLTEYIDTEDLETFNAIISGLSSEINRKYAADIVDVCSYKLTNFTIDKIKEIADKNSDSVSKPSSTGFKEFVLNRLELERNIKTIITSITDKEACEYETLGSLEEKGTLRIKKLYRMLCDDSKTKEFTLGIRALNATKDLLIEIDNKITKSDVYSVVAQLNDSCDENNINSSEQFLGKSKHIITEDGNEYSPSNGEKGILMLQRSLDKEEDAYFLDEPELGMGNSYINNTICPKIEQLAKRHKAIIIATHNANIAVRSLPYTSIFRMHENGKYKTYIGNPFDDKMVNISDSTDVKSWSEESMHTLEGGKEAFYERKYIYESNG